MYLRSNIWNHKVCFCSSSQLIKKCWCHNITMRPTFEQVKKMLDKMNPHKVSPVDMMMNLVTALCNIIKQDEDVFQIVIIITDKRKKDDLATSESCDSNNGFFNRRWRNTASIWSPSWLREHKTFFKRNRRRTDCYTVRLNSRGMPCMCSVKDTFSNMSEALPSFRSVSFVVRSLPSSGKTKKEQAPRSLLLTFSE